MTLTGSKPATSLEAVKYPYHAWLAPVAGIGAAIVVNLIMLLLLGADDASQIVRFIRGLLPLTALIACIGFGFFKSVQCTIGKRRPGHGTVGFAVNSLAILIIAALIYSIFIAHARAASPQYQAQSAARELYAELPIRVDSTTTMVDAYTTGEQTLVLVYEVQTFITQNIRLDQRESEFLNKVNRPNSPFRSLLDSGGNIKNIYQNRDEVLLLEFTVPGKLQNP